MLPLQTGGLLKACYLAVLLGTYGGPTCRLAAWPGCGCSELRVPVPRLCIAPPAATSTVQQSKHSGIAIVGRHRQLAGAATNMAVPPVAGAPPPLSLLLLVLVCLALAMQGTTAGVDEGRADVLHPATSCQLEAQRCFPQPPRRACTLRPSPSPPEWPPPRPLPICPCAVAIMHSLRQSLVDAGGRLAEPHPGWQPGDPTPPCQWQNVQCNSAGSITDL